MRQIRRAGRSLVGAVLLASLAVVLSSCGHPYPRLSDLQRIPAAHLIPPGAVLLTDGGGDSDTKAGYNAAFIDDTYATPDAASTVMNFYDRHLRSLGWTPDQSIRRARSEWTTVASWRDGNRVLEVGIQSAEQRSREVTAYPSAVGAATTFEIYLQ